MALIFIILLIALVSLAWKHPGTVLLIFAGIVSLGVIGQAISG